MEHWNRRSVLATGAFIAVGTGMAAGKSKRTDSPTFVEADGWSSLDGGAQRARRASALEAPETVAWRTDGSDPVVVDGTAYLGGESVRALDTADGSLAWETDLDGRTRGLTVVDGTVYAGGAELVALDAATGDVRWSTAVGSDGDVPPPVIAYGTAYVLAGGSLYAFDASDGTHRWERDAVAVNGQAMPFQTSPSQLVAANGAVWSVLDGNQSDGLAKLDPETGETWWSGYVDAGTGGLAATDETLLVENNSLEAVYTFDAETKATERKINDAYVTAADAGVAVTQGRYQVEATPLEDADATEGWSHDGSYTHGNPVIAGDTVVVTYSTPGPDGGDSIVGFDLRDGTERWRFEFEDGESWTDGADAGFLVVENDVIYTQRGNGLVAIRPESWEKSDSTDAEDAESDPEDDDTEDGTDDADGEDEYQSGEDEDTDDDAAGDDDASDDAGAENGESDDTNGGTDDADDDDDSDDEGMPGFTAGVGIAGGALGLEWVRRRADSDDDRAA